MEHLTIDQRVKIIKSYYKNSDSAVSTFFQQNFLQVMKLFFRLVDALINKTVEFGAQKTHN